MYVCIYMQLLMFAAAAHHVISQAGKIYIWLTLIRNMRKLVRWL